MLKFGLKDDATKIVLNIFKAYPQIEEVILFGSRALNTFKATSDIDFAIKGKNTHSILAALIDDFEESDLIYEVDVVDYERITSEKLIEHIDRHGVLFYRKGWVETTLGEYIEIKHGFSFKGEYISGIENENILVTPGNFKVGGGFKNEKFKYYDGTIPDDYILEKNDIIITMTDLSKTGDTLGFPARVPSSAEITYLHNQRIGLIQFKKKEINKEFLYWLMRTRIYQKTIVNSSTGSTVRHTSPSRVQEYVFFKPKSSDEQKAIAAVLSAFDEKIDLLREQNKTLETLAQTIFKEWFVMFNYPNSTGEMVDSELGDIPKGWRVGTLRDVVDIFDSKRSSFSSLMKGINDRVYIHIYGATKAMDPLLRDIFILMEHIYD